MLWNAGWIALLLGTAGTPAYAQTEAEGLVIESQDGRQTESIAVGQRIDYRLKGGDLHRKGRLEAVTDSGLTVAGRPIAFQDVAEVVMVKGHKHPRGSRLARFSFIGMVLSGLLFLLTVALYRGRSTSSQRGLILVFALLGFAFFPILLIVGLILLAGSRKRFDLTDGWKLRRR